MRSSHSCVCQFPESIASVEFRLHTSRSLLELRLHGMAREDMALRLDETSRTVDTIQHVVARQSVTRQTKTLHGITGEMARRSQEPCDTISSVGTRQKCLSSEAHVIDCLFFLIR